MKLPHWLNFGAALAGENGKKLGAGNAKNGGSTVRSRMGLILAILTVLNVALLVLLFRPPSTSVAQRQAEYAQSRSNYEQTLGTVKQMRDLRTKLESAIQNDQKFSKNHFLSRRTAFSEMLSDLEKQASKDGLKTSSISYDLHDETDQPGYIKVGVSMTIDGAYPDLVHFINRLEQSDLFWIIDNLTVSTGSVRGLRLNLKMATYAVTS